MFDMFISEILQYIAEYLSDVKQILALRHVCKKTMIMYTPTFTCKQTYSFLYVKDIRADTNSNTCYNREYINKIIYTEYINNKYNTKHNLLFMKNLTHLDLYDNSNVLHPADLIYLPNLTYLSANFYSPLHVRNISHLKSLHTLVTDFINDYEPCIEYPPNLKYINCTILYTGIHFSRVAKQLKRLVIFTLCDIVTVIIDLIKQGLFINIEEMNIGYGISINCIKYLPSLTKLNTWHHKVTDEHLLYLTNLNKLILGTNCLITDSSLINCTKLTELTFSYNIYRLIEYNSKVTDLSIQYLINLKMADFSNNKLLTNKCLVNLINLTELHCNNNFTDNGIIHLKNLKILHLHDNTKITDNSISKLTNICILSCGKNNNLTDKSLLQLPFLKFLNCGYDHKFSDISLRNIEHIEYD